MLAAMSQQRPPTNGTLSPVTASSRGDNNTELNMSEQSNQDHTGNINNTSVTSKQTRRKSTVGIDDQQSINDERAASVASSAEFVELEAELEQELYDDDDDANDDHDQQERNTKNRNRNASPSIRLQNNRSPITGHSLTPTSARVDSPIDHKLRPNSPIPLVLSPSPSSPQSTYKSDFTTPNSPTTGASTNNGGDKQTETNNATANGGNKSTNQQTSSQSNGRRYRLLGGSSTLSLSGHNNPITPASNGASLAARKTPINARQSINQAKSRTIDTNNNRARSLASQKSRTFGSSTSALNVGATRTVSRLNQTKVNQSATQSNIPTVAVNRNNPTNGRSIAGLTANRGMNGNQQQQQVRTALLKSTNVAKRTPTTMSGTNRVANKLTATSKANHDINDNNRQQLNNGHEQQNQIKDLMANVASLQSQLEHQRLERERTVGELEIACSERDEQIQQLERELHDRTIESERQLADNTRKLSEAHEAHDKTRRASDVLISEARQRIDELETQLNEVKEFAAHKDEMIDRLRELQEKLSEQRVHYEHEMDELRNQMGAQKVSKRFGQSNNSFAYCARRLRKSLSHSTLDSSGAVDTSTDPTTTNNGQLTQDDTIYSSTYRLRAQETARNAWKASKSFASSLLASSSSGVASSCRRLCPSRVSISSNANRPDQPDRQPATSSATCPIHGQKQTTDSQQHPTRDDKSRKKRNIKSKIKSLLSTNPSNDVTTQSVPTITVNQQPTERIRIEQSNNKSDESSDLSADVPVRQTSIISNNLATQIIVEGSKPSSQITTKTTTDVVSIDTTDTKDTPNNLANIVIQVPALSQNPHKQNDVHESSAINLSIIGSPTVS